jgi:nucleoside-diphosphate-sugar epimerase
MNVLIIGGTGLISTPMTRILLEHGHSVTHFNRGSKRADFPEVKTIVGDRTDYATFKETLRNDHFDCVIDMVCYTPADARSVIETFPGAVNQYIFCSTVDVYSKPAPAYPITEDAPRQPSPEFPYAYNKAQCEEIFLDSHRQNGFPVTIIRPAYTYHEGAGILHTFGWSTGYLARMRQGKPIITHGDGHSFWVACHAEDVARAFVNAVGNVRTLGRAYHVTGDEWLTWRQYHAAVAEALGCELQLTPIPIEVLYHLVPEQSFWARVNFQYNNLFDNSAAKRDLDFRYTVSWREGARRMIDWLEAQAAIDEDEPYYDTVVETWQRCLSALPGPVQRTAV